MRIWIELLDWGERFQQAITGIVVGLIGFWGVIRTIRANGRLAREQLAQARKQELERLREARDYERQVLVEALVAELVLTKRSLDASVQSIERQMGAPEVEFAAIRQTPVLDQSIEKLGNLPRRNIQDVLAVRATLHALDEADSRFPAPPGNVRADVVVPAMYVEGCLRVYREAAKFIVTVIKRLDPNAEVGPTAD